MNNFDLYILVNSRYFYHIYIISDLVSRMDFSLSENSETGQFLYSKLRSLYGGFIVLIFIVTFLSFFIFKRCFYNYNLLNNTWFVQWPKMPRETHLGAPVLVHLICTEIIQMNNCQLPEYTLQNTKMYNIIS